MKNKVFVFVIILLHACYSYGQGKSVGIGTLSPDNSAVLDLESGSQGFLMPRLDSVQVYDVLKPAQGLILFNDQDQCYWFRKRSGWKRICSTDSLNNLYVSTQNFLADSVLAKFISTKIIYGDTGIFNFLNAHFAKLDSIYNVFLNSQHINADSIFNKYFIGVVIKADSGVYNYLNAKYSNLDTIVNVYLNSQHILADTGIFNYLSVKRTNLDTITNEYLSSKHINTDSLYLNGSPIQQVINTAIDSTAWLLKGNTGINSLNNFIGTINPADWVVKTSNTERMRVLADGKIGVGIKAPLSGLDLAGQITLRAGAGLGYLLQSDKNGTGSWQKVSSVINNSYLNAYAWEISGNTGTNAASNFLGTSDDQDLAFRTGNAEKMRILVNGNIGIGTNNPLTLLSVGNGSLFRVGTSGLVNIINGTVLSPAISFISNGSSGIYSAGTNKIDFAVNGANVFDIDRSMYTILLQTPVGTNSTITGNSDILIGEGTLNGAASLLIGTDPVNFSTLMGNQSGAIGFKNFVNGSTCFVLGGSNSIKAGSPAGGTLIFGSNNSITSAVSSNNIIIGSSNTIKGTGYSNILIGGNISCNNDYNIILNPGQTPISTTANLQFLAVAPLGIKFYTTNNLSSGVQVAAGGGSWASVSDRTLKENIVKLNADDVLKRFCSIPVTEWSYIAQRPDTKCNEYSIQPRHIGIMAQDFNKVFAYGEFDTRITDMDLMGVLSASVQALEKEIEELTVKLNELSNQKGK